MTKMLAMMLFQTRRIELLWVSKGELREQRFVDEEEDNAK